MCHPYSRTCHIERLTRPRLLVGNPEHRISQLTLEVLIVHKLLEQLGFVSYFPASVNSRFPVSSW